MKSHKFFVQDRYGTTYRIYRGYEAPVLGPTKPQNLSAEHDAHEFIIIPKGKKPVAYYHTHGGDDPVYDNENFSNIYDPVDKEWYGDIPYADSNKIDGYLATPKGKFKYYSHKNNQVKLISEL